MQINLKLEDLHAPLVKVAKELRARLDRDSIDDNMISIVWPEELEPTQESAELLKRDCISLLEDLGYQANERCIMKSGNNREFIIQFN